MAIAMLLGRIRRPGHLLLGLGLEREGSGIEAVPQAGRRAVGEDMPEMTDATAACRLRAHHVADAVLVLLDPSFDRPRKARPAGARLELGVRDEPNRAVNGTPTTLG